MVELASSEGLPAIAERITAHIEGLQGELLPQGPRRILDPICEQNQAEPNARISRFNRLEYALPERYDGSREIPDAEIETYGATVLGAQSGRGAADLIAAAHRAGPFGTPGRDSELKFARTAQGIADAYGFYDPDPDDPTQRPRRLYVKLIVHLRDLRGPRGEELLAAYAEIDCDGIIAAIAGFHDDAIDEEILEGASWLFELRRRAEKPVFSSAPGELGLPLVQHGSTACTSRSTPGPAFLGRIGPPTPCALSAAFTPISSASSLTSRLGRVKATLMHCSPSWAAAARAILRSNFPPPAWYVRSTPWFRGRSSRPCPTPRLNGAWRGPRNSSSTIGSAR